MRAELRASHGDGEQLTTESAELHRLSTPVSLNKKVGDDGDAELGDLMITSADLPEDSVFAAIDSELLERLVDTLPSKRSRRAIRLRFGLETGEPMPYSKVGEHFGVTAEAARRLVSRAIAELREYAKYTGDFDY